MKCEKEIENSSHACETEVKNNTNYNKKINWLCGISLLFFIFAEFWFGKNSISQPYQKSIYFFMKSEPHHKIIYLFTFTVGFISMLYARLKYPKNKGAFALMWLYIIDIFLKILPWLLILFVLLLCMQLGG